MARWYYTFLAAFAAVAAVLDFSDHQYGLAILLTIATVVIAIGTAVDG